MKILIVDDDKVSLAKMKAILSKYGSVDLAENGKIALESVQKAYEDGKPYELCTMDIEMPELDGTETVDLIRKYEQENKIYNSELKIIMVTVKGHDNNIISSFYNGCEWYLRKPVTPEDIQSALKKIELI